MLVEDDASIRLLLQVTLEARGYQIEMIGDGGEALERLRTGEAPQVLVLDLMIPGISGLELIPAIKLDPKLAHIPIIVLSARVMPEAINEALRCGARAFLKKPFDPDELAQAIAEAIACR